MNIQKNVKADMAKIKIHLKGNGKFEGGKKAYK
jgi:hypothetical protein